MVFIITDNQKNKLYYNGSPNPRKTPFTRNVDECKKFTYLNDALWTCSILNRLFNTENLIVEKYV